MAKATKKKSAKQASSLFHNIIAASVSGNPKPKAKSKAGAGVKKKSTNK
jgi:hypothetical protein